MARLTAARLLLPLMLTLLLWEPTPASAKWQTLNGQAPVVIANGGLSGLFPDQTSDAYYYALYDSLPGVVLSCDLQLSPDPTVPQLGAVGICRTGLDLSVSTDILHLAPQFNTTRLVNGKNTTGFYAIDIPYVNLTANAFATQSVTARSPAFDNVFQILSPANIPGIINQSGSPLSTMWLNSEYTQFIETNSNLNATLYLLAAIQDLFPGYVSVPEINLLKTVQATAQASNTKLIYKFLDTGATADPSTNQSYTSLLQNLTYIKTFADGILVPKTYIWTVDPNTLYYLPPSTLVDDAHTAGLEVYAYDFANDEYPITSNNFTFDPITEILYYIENSYNFSVDGLFTDFPTTASEAISCYAVNSRNTSLQSKAAIVKKPKVISHNGNSGKYPGATTEAYLSAIDAGVDYIDCVVQISKDSVPFCRPTVNLIDTTNASTNSILAEKYGTTYPGFNGGKYGIYTFDLTYDLISPLKANMYSPQPSILRDQNYNGLYSIISLADFLSLAKNNSKGALIAIQNAVYIREQHNIAVVDAVVDVLSAAGYNSTDRVIVQSEDSSALARLRELNVTYPLMYEVPYSPSDPISLDATDFVDIKKYASMVNFNARLVEPFDSVYFLTSPPVDVIKLARAQNLTTYFEVQKNEFTAFAFDFQSDPALELFSLLNDGIDGIITDFPITVKNFLVNQCLGDGLTSSTVNYTIPLVLRGALLRDTHIPAPANAPYPDLVVVESPLEGLPVAEAPAPEAEKPASATHISISFLAAASGLVLYVLAVV